MEKQRLGKKKYKSLSLTIIEIKEEKIYRDLIHAPNMLVYQLGIFKDGKSFIFLPLNVSCSPGHHW